MPRHHRHNGPEVNQARKVSLHFDIDQASGTVSIDGAANDLDTFGRLLREFAASDKPILRTGNFVIMKRFTT